MKHQFLAAHIFLIAAGPAWTQVPEVVGQIQRDFEKQLSELEAAYLTKRSELIQARLEALKNAQDFYTRKGELDTALAIKQEIERTGHTVPGDRPEPAASNLNPSALEGLRPGLVVTEYPRQESQVKDRGFVRYSRFKEIPVEGEKKVIRSVRSWNFTEGKNACAVGYLKIDQPGEYQFNSNSFYDRNALYIQDEESPLCGYRDGEGNIASITLAKGMVRIVSIGYVDSRGLCKVQWIPPGQEKLSTIPEDLLFHAAADR